MAEAYPLAWPQGWPRAKEPESSKFKQTPEKARIFLVAEVERLGGIYLVISTNIELRRDGFPYANRRNPADRGVAIYFQLKGRSMVFACDRYKEVHDNMYAIGLTVEALRGIERWGASQMMERAFSGFTALPPAIEMPAAKRPWWEVLGVNVCSSPEQIRNARNELARKYHPDTATIYMRDKTAKIAEINAAFKEAMSNVK